MTSAAGVNHNGACPAPPAANAESNDQSASPASNKSLPKVVLVCRATSHPFQDRQIAIENPVKVGRAVARCKPSADNAIFDCKVLSRNHALIWYGNRKFFLQDTRSSNGTFVNSQRLSPANEESPPREVVSGDIVQFGVDVIENTKKVTHGCIIALLKLYHPDGTEAKASHEYSIYGSNYLFPPGSNNLGNYSSRNLYMIAQYLKEAVQREEMLRNKLSSLQSIINAAQESSESGWKCLVEEDRLISRIESLQSRLESLLNSSYSNDVEETVLLKKELVKLHEEKEKYELSAKQIIQKTFEDKMAAYARIFELETSLKSAEEECSRLREVCDSLEKDISALTENQDKQLQEIEELRFKSKESEEKVSLLTETVKQEKNRFDNKGSEFQQRESELEGLVAQLKEKNEASSLEIERLKLDLEVSKKELCSKEKARSGDLFLEAPVGQLGQQKAIRLNRSFPEMLKSKLEQRLVSSVSIVDSDISSTNEEKGTLTNGELANHQNSSQLSPAEVNSDIHESSQYISEIELLKKLLAETRFAKKNLEEKVIDLEKELQSLQMSRKTMETQAESMEAQLRAVKCKLEEKNRCLETANSKIVMLEEQLKNMQRDNEVLNTKLLESERLNLQQQEELDYVKNSLEEEREVQNQIKLVVEDLRTQLVKLKTGKLEDRVVSSNEEELDQLKAKLEVANKDTAEYQEKLQQITNEVSKMRLEREETLQKQEDLQKQLISIKEDYDLVNYQNKMASACAIVPILILILAIVFAYYPDVSSVTGTIES